MGKDTPHMSTHDIHQDIQKIDRQIVELIAERMDLYRLAIADDEEGVTTADHVSEALADWEEAAEEKGWNAGLMSKVCRGIVDLCKSGVSDE
jgi:chorismate mutase